MRECRSLRRRLADLVRILSTRLTPLYCLPTPEQLLRRSTLLRCLTPRSNRLVNIEATVAKQARCRLHAPAPALPTAGLGSYSRSHKRHRTCHKRSAKEYPNRAAYVHRDRW